MRDDLRIPDLTFPQGQLGPKETQWGLLPLLYRGGAASNAGKVARLIQSGELGEPLFERLDLVLAMHAVISGRLAGGRSQKSQEGYLDSLRTFYAWADQGDVPLTLDTAIGRYVGWTESLIHRVQVHRTLVNRSAYGTALRVGSVLGNVFERALPLIGLTRLSNPSQRKSARSVQSDKQNLSWTFAFGSLLQDICDALTVKAVWGPLPVRIPLRNGGELVEASGMKAPRKAPRKAPADSTEASKQRYQQRVAETTRLAWAEDRTLRTRYPLTNLRTEAELLMFVGQTGMNLAQAHKLRMCDFFYSSDIDGYKVGDRKNRRGGDVLFEIYREYRAHFERYLDWRREVFPNDPRLFPFVTRSRADTEPTQLSRMRKTCEKLGIAFVAPSVLRSTRVNWLLRRSGDADMTAEMAQHSKETLLGVYEVPSLHRTMGEAMRFWSKADPAIARTTPVAPGECDGVPTPVSNMPNDAPTPDCVRASGCLWCEHHRDIDSQDHVWALNSFRQLKVIEISKYRPPERDESQHPAQHAVDRLSAKLRWFKNSNAVRRAWVDEALARVEEGTYHPDWAGLLESAEGVSP
jgi:hypothetical protein